MSEVTAPPALLVRGILLAHGGMASGMVDAVTRIAGQDPDALIPLSNEGCSHETLCSRVDELAGGDPVILFTDLHAGSCAVAARLSCRELGPRGIVFGANLPMLLDFVFHRSLPLDELVPRLVERGREGVQGIQPRSGCGDPPLPR